MTPFQWVAMVASKDPTRSADLSRVWVRHSRMAATDGHRIHLHQTDLQDGEYQVDGVRLSDRVEPFLNWTRLVSPPEDLPPTEIPCVHLREWIQTARQDHQLIVRYERRLAHAKATASGEKYKPPELGVPRVILADLGKGIFNARYLEEAIKGCKGSVNLRGGVSLDPIHIDAPDGRVALIMPMAR